MNGTSDPSIYPSVAISKSLLDYFPVEAQESLKTGMESCYNITSRKFLTLKWNGKYFVLKKCLLIGTQIQLHPQKMEKSSRCRKLV